MNSPVQKIKERLGIEEIVSSYIKLDRAGANLKARCPFHNEKTPSFFVSPDRGSYYCFGCGASGDIFTFVEEFEGLDFKGALKLLAERAGVELGKFDKKTEDKKEKLYRIMDEAAIYFVQNLSGDVIKYLKSRGLEDKTIESFRIGFARDEWRGAYEHLKLNFSDQEIEQAGLAKKSDKGMYDRFRGRVMFPIADSSGRVIAFSGRIFIDDGKSAKYLNSPETPIFSKSHVLYGLDRAKESIRKNNFSILVEGQIDLVLSHQAGYKNTIAASGTALSDDTLSKENVISNFGLVRRLSPNIVLAFDGDKAGFNAMGKAGRIALSLGMDVKVAGFPEGSDPADLISKGGKDAWKEAIKNSKHIIEFILEKVLAEAGDARKAGKEIKEKVLPYVNLIDSSIEKTYFIKKISDASSIPLKALEDDLKKIERDSKGEKEELEKTLSNERKLLRRDYIERKLLGIALWREDENLLKTLGPIRDKYKDLNQDLIFEAEVFYGGSADLDRDVAEMLSNLEEEQVNEELLIKIQELRMIKDKDREATVLKEINELNKRKEAIKNSRQRK
ncbi:MAG TPA: DNA primase [Candidatus Paceibacterota bacterium]